MVVATPFFIYPFGGFVLLELIALVILVLMPPRVDDHHLLRNHAEAKQ